MHGVEPCLGQTLCALSVPRPASPFGETIFTDSLNLSIFNLKRHYLKTVYGSGDAWSRTTLALISYAFCALSVPRPASPFVKATFTGSLNILSNTNMVKVKDEKNLSFPRLGSSCSFIKTNKKLCNHNPISVIPRQAVCRRSAGVWQTTQTGAHQCATAPRLQPLSR